MDRGTAVSKVDRQDVGLLRRDPKQSQTSPRITHLITIIPASQLHFLANEDAELAGGSQ